MSVLDAFLQQYLSKHNKKYTKVAYFVKHYKGDERDESLIDFLVNRGISMEILWTDLTKAICAKSTSKFLSALDESVQLNVPKQLPQEKNCPISKLWNDLKEATTVFSYCVKSKQIILLRMIMGQREGDPKWEKWYNCEKLCGISLQDLLDSVVECGECSLLCITCMGRFGKGSMSIALNKPEMCLHCKGFFEANGEEIPPFPEGQHQRMIGFLFQLRQNPKQHPVTGESFRYCQCGKMWNSDCATHWAFGGKEHKEKK
jgi:hypothetical protein